MMSNTDLSQLLQNSNPSVVDLLGSQSQMNQPDELNAKLQQVCSLLVQLTEEQRQTNGLLRKIVLQDAPGGYKLVKLGNQEKYIRYLIVLENEKSRPRIDCPFCMEDVEITTAKRGGCKQQSFCGHYVVCNECSNDALQKILRCPVCCENYSNIPVPLCSHLSDASVTEGHLARKGSGNGCPLCSNKLVKDKCPENCVRKELTNYNMAKTILADHVFVLVKNPESCTDEEDRPCSHYCRCPIHNILFTNRNKGAKCRECKESVKPPKITGKRKRQKTSDDRDLSMKQYHTNSMPVMNINNNMNCVQNVNPSLLQQQQQQQHIPMLSHQQQQQMQQQQQQQQQHHPNDISFSFMDQQGNPQAQQSSGMANWLPLSFNVKELGRKVNLDDIFERIPYGEGVMEFGKRVTSTLGFGNPPEQ